MHAERPNSHLDDRQEALRAPSLISPPSLGVLMQPSSLIMSRRRLIAVTCGLGLACAALGAAASSAEATPAPILLSSLPNGHAPVGASSTPVFSANGAWAVFSSEASTLVGGDTNGKRDIFIRNVATNKVYLVTRSYLPTKRANGDSDSQFNFRVDLGVSVDGRYVVFDSAASNLVPGDTNGQDDVFRWDRLTGKTSLVSARFGHPGLPGNSFSRSPHVSGDGRFVVFQTNATNLTSSQPKGANGSNNLQVVVRDMVAGTTRFASLKADGKYPDSFSERSDISANGRVVVFQSMATNLVAGDTNASTDIFARDLVTGKLEIVSRTNTGVLSPAMSQDATLSGDGRFVVFESDGALTSNDSNALGDIFVRDRFKHTTSLRSVTPSGVQFATKSARLPRISADGRRVVFDTGTAVYLRQLGIPHSEEVTPYDADLATISGNGDAVGIEATDSLVGSADGNAMYDAYLLRQSIPSDVTRPTVVFSGPYAVLSDASGIAMVTVAGHLVRPDSANRVAVRAGQTIVVWDGAGLVTSKRR